MKKITLHTAAVDRDGKRREAGEVLSVGKTRAYDLDEDAARALVKKGAAVVLPVKAQKKPAAAAKPAAKKPAATGASTVPSGTGADAVTSTATK